MKTAFCTLLLCLLLAVSAYAGVTLVDPVVIQTDHPIYINIEGLEVGQTWFLSDDYACTNTSNQLVTTPVVARAVPGVYYLCASDINSNTTEYYYTGQQAHVIVAVAPSVVRRSWTRFTLEALFVTAAANATLFATVNNCNEPPRATYNFNTTTFSAGEFVGRSREIIYCYDAPGLGGAKQVKQFTKMMSTIPLVTSVDNGVTFNRKMFSNAEGPKTFEAVSYIPNDKLYLASSQNLTRATVIPMAGQDGIFTVSGNLPKINSVDLGGISTQTWYVFASPAVNNTPTVFISSIIFGVPAFSVDPQVVPVSGNPIPVTVNSEFPANTEIYVSLQMNCEGRYTVFPRSTGGRTLAQVAFVVPSALYYVCVTVGPNSTFALSQITTYSRARTIPSIIDRNIINTIVTVVDEDSTNSYYLADNEGHPVGTVIPDGKDNSFVLPAKYPGPHFDLMYKTQADVHPAQAGLYVDLNIDFTPDIIPAMAETVVTIEGGFGEDTLGPFRKHPDEFAFFHYDSSNKCSSPVDMTDGRVEFTEYRSVTFRGFPPTALDLCTRGQDTFGWVYSGKTLFIGGKGEFASPTVLQAMGVFYLPVMNTDPSYEYSVATRPDCINDEGHYFAEYNAIFLQDTPAEGTKYYLCFKPSNLVGFAFPVIGESAVVPMSAYLLPEKVTRQPINKGYRTVRLMGSAPSVNNQRFFMCPLRSDNINSCNVACYGISDNADLANAAVPGSQRIPLIDSVFVLPTVPEFAKALICRQDTNGLFYETGLTFSVDTGITLLPNKIHRSNDPQSFTIFGALPTDNIGVAVESCAGPMVALFGTSRSVSVVPQVSGSHFVICFLNPIIGFFNTLASEQIMNVDVRANIQFTGDEFYPYTVTGQDRHDIFAWSNSPTCTADITSGHFVRPINLGYYKYLSVPTSILHRINGGDPNVRLCVRQQASSTWVPVDTDAVGQPNPTETPTPMPLPTNFPTSFPTPLPTDMPTTIPTTMPTDMPSNTPMPTL